MNELFNCIDVSLGGKSKRTQKRIAEYMNNMAWKNAYFSFCLKALARYDIEGLTTEMSKRVVLSSLLYHGNICIFEKDGAILALPAVPAGNPNINGDYLSCWVYGRNGFNEEIPLYIPGADENAIMQKGYLSLNQSKKPRGVLVRENEYMYPFINQCIDYAAKVSDGMRTIDVIRKNLKRPYVIACEEQLVPTVKKFMEQKDENYEYIVSTGVFPADKIQILPFETNSEAMKVTTDNIDWTINKFDDLCMFNNSGNIAKRERMTVSETEQNNDSIEKKRKKFRDFLQEQFDFANKCFSEYNLNIKLKEEESNDDILRMDQNAETEQMAAGRSDSGDA